MDPQIAIEMAKAAFPGYPLGNVRFVETRQVCEEYDKTSWTVFFNPVYVDLEDLPPDSVFTTDSVEHTKRSTFPEVSGFTYITLKYLLSWEDKELLRDLGKLVEETYETTMC